MPTRGCIAVKKGNSWAGVYVPYHSYPTKTGRDFWRHLMALKEEGKLNTFEEELLKYSEWPEYLSKNKKYEVARGAEGKLMAENADPAIIDWVYIYDPEKEVIEVQVSHKTTGKTLQPSSRGGCFTMCNYVLKKVATLHLADPPPNFHNVQSKGVSFWGKSMMFS